MQQFNRQCCGKLSGGANRKAGYDAKHSLRKLCFDNYSVVWEHSWGRLLDEKASNVVRYDKGLYLLICMLYK